jgi:archaemetzincin
VAEPYPELEEKLRPLADPLSPPRPGDWLAEHDEPGQTFAEYLDARPVRKSDKLHTIYLCLVGDFSEAQRRILALTQDYLAVFFDCPVKVQRQIALEPERPADALAYLALTASDLWPGKGWNFVFGEASLRQRIGVWSIYRNGDPGEDFTLCLRRTLSTASHETGHILGMAHCTAYLCLMNGSNHQEEKDRRLMHLCPVCQRKLCWNLRAEPVPYLMNLKAFCQQNRLDPESGWYERAMAALAT